MQYEFLIVKCNRGDFEGIELFVDPYFREQFEIPHPTEHYAKLLQVGVCMTVTECVCLWIPTSVSSLRFPTPQSITPSCCRWVCV